MFSRPGCLGCFGKRGGKVGLVASNFGTSMGVCVMSFSAILEGLGGQAASGM